MKQVVMTFSPVPCYFEAGKAGPYDCQELGFKWLDWVTEFSADSIRNYELILLVRPQTQLPESVNAWGKVIRFAENSFVAQYPLGPNLVFRQVLWLQYHSKITGPFLWCEPDCVPVKSNWLDLIANAYERAGKPFMGNIVEPVFDKVIGARVPRHMTGNAVYPDKAYKEAPKLMEANYTPWDVLAAPEILPKCHQTDLIQHEFRAPEITSLQDLNAIVKPNTALFHTDKFGAIMRLLGSGKLEPVSLEQVFDPVPSGQVREPNLDVCSLDDLLEDLEVRCRDPLAQKAAAKFLVEHKIVNQGHLSYYGKGGRPRKNPQLSDDEFKKLIGSKSDVAVAPTN